MTGPRSEFSWPALPERYLSALQEAVTFALSVAPSAVGVVAAGSIVRGTPDPSSDLDVYVVQMDAFRQRIQKRFRSVPAEIFINPPSAIRGYFGEEAAHSRPLTAHMLATGHVVLCKDPVVTALIDQARVCLSQAPVIPTELTQARYLLATLVEDGVDLRGRDVESCRMILSLAMEQLLRHLFLKAGRYQPRPKDLLHAVSAIDAEVGRLARLYYRSRRIATQVRIAERIADRVIGVHGFFEWQTEPQRLD